MLSTKSHIRVAEVAKSHLRILQKLQKINVVSTKLN